MRLRTISILGAAMVLAARPAPARVTVCDKYSATIHAALATVINGDTETQGWWTVAPGTCVVVDAGPLASPFYLVARTDPDPQGNLQSWGTGKSFAVSLDKFHYYDAEKVGKGDNALEFDEVTKPDVKDLPNVTWTVANAQGVSLSYDEKP